MGVSGCGKTTVGTALAERLGWNFYDADDFHPPENVAKMASGIPLNDADRYPWLVVLHDLISTSLEKGKPGVLACSALKESYREILLKNNENVQIVYLKGSFNLILSRMQARSSHYMKPEMLQSQFDALEEPEMAITVPISVSVNEIVSYIVKRNKRIKKHYATVMTISMR
ncbi:MAG: gluconokinase [Chloroflexi bacterium]|nr:gluconokinase [Chloroflexota bacterium]